MDKIYIKVNKKTGMVYLDDTVIGRDKENLQQELIFSFENGFVSGSPRLEYEIAHNKYHIPAEKINETYVVPVKNVLNVEGKVEMQLVVVQQTENNEIPVFKSNVFYMYCNKSINAQEEAPDDYEYWLDVIQTKLADIDDALEEVGNLDIDATKIGKVATVSITDKDGITKSVEITDGTDGEKGETGPANTLAIGNVVKGDEANASITGDAPNQTLNLVLPKGDKGEKGDTGNTGATGPSNVLSIGTVTKGESASATITGTSPNQVLNLVLPKGDKGDTGEAGPQGIPGANGTNGTNGQDGFSPIATVTQTQSGATISITDKNGTTTASISDGEEYDDTEIRSLIAEKQDELVSGTNIKTINNTSILGSGNIDIQGGGTDDYSQLSNKPQINSVTLNGNKSLSDLGIQPSGNYALKSEIPDVSDFITKNVNDLTYYYTKTEVDGKLSAVYKYKGTVATYSDLPSTGLTVGDVYNVETDGNNYAWTGTVWDALGGTVDLSGYQTKIDSTHKLSSDLVDDTNNTNKFVTSAEKTTWSNKYDKPLTGIPSTDLSSTVQTSLSKADTAIQSSDLTNYVANTDYPTNQDAGVIKTSDIYGVQSVSGQLMGSTRTIAQYSTDVISLLISKGTLENVLANKGYETDSNKVTSISSSSTNTEYPSALAVYNYIQSLDASEVSY